MLCTDAEEQIFLPQREKFGSFEEGKFGSIDSRSEEDSWNPCLCTGSIYISLGPLDLGPADGWEILQTLLGCITT